MTTLRCKEDKLWSVLVHPHPHDAGARGLNNNMPRWKMPAKARNEFSEAMVRDHHFLKGGFKEFYGAEGAAASAAGGASGSAAGAASPPRTLPSMHPGGDRKHFVPRYCEEKSWHPSFKRAVLDIFPARATGKRALTPPNENNRTEVTDIPRGKKRVEGAERDEMSELPMFRSVRAVRDGKTGQRLMDKRCEESAEQIALRRGTKKLAPMKDDASELARLQRKTDTVRVAGEVEFRREYNARLAATLVNRDATNRDCRETAAANETLGRHRASVRRAVHDRSRMYDVDCVRRLPAFTADADD